MLCTVPDQAKALAEIQRVLKPSGRFLFMEHVRSQTPRLARWQDRLQPLWFRFAYGCHCNVDTLPVIEAGGFSVERLQKGDIPRALPIMRPVVTGQAVLA